MDLAGKLTRSITEFSVLYDQYELKSQNDALSLKGVLTPPAPFLVQTKNIMLIASHLGQSKLPNQKDKCSRSVLKKDL